MATMGPKKSGSTSGIGGANDMQAVASLAVLAKIHAEVRADINPGLLNAIQEHETANAAWLATSDGDLPTGTMEEKAADQAEKKLIHFPCRSHADVLAKVGYLYQQNTEAARAAHDTVQAGYLDELLGSLVGLSMSEELGGLVESVADPLLEAINAFRTELARFNAASLDSNEAAQEFAAQTFEPRLKVLVQWNEPAATLDGAKEALRLMVEEIECFERPEALAPLLRAALGYLESAAAPSSLTAEKSVSPKLLDLIECHRQAVILFDEHPDDTQLSEKEDRLALEIAAYPAETGADRAAKAEYLLTRSDPWKFCPHEDMYPTLLRSMVGLKDDNVPQGAAPYSSAEVLGTSPHPDTELIAWGEEMERLVEVFNQAYDAAVAVEEESQARGIARGSDAYWAFIGPSHDKATEASDAVDVAAALIRNKEAATPAGLVVKAKALRWDACLYGDDELPVEEWDWDKECVHLFIAELQRFAAAHLMT